MVNTSHVLVSLAATGAVAQHGTSTISSASASTTASAVATLTPTAGAVPLFSYERAQLTTASLRNVSSDDAGLFAFDSINVTIGNTPSCVNYTLAGPGDCKVFPGDVSWPTASGWQALSSLTGGALLKPVPAASVCYFNGTSKHNDTTCAALAANWTNSYTQYVYSINARA